MHAIRLDSTRHSTHTFGMIQILVASDYPVIRAGLPILVEAGGVCQVLGVAASSAELLKLAAQLCPEIILLDLSLAESEGLDILWHLRDQSPDVAIVVLSDDEGDDRILTALQAGARGYLLKRATAEEIDQAIRTVRQGGLVLHPLVAAALLQRLGAMPPAAPPDEHLTPRELEVLQLLARGLTNKAIAARLQISEHTVKFHIGSIMGKLGAESRTEAVAIAARRGLVML